MVQRSDAFDVFKRTTDWVHSIMTKYASVGSLKVADHIMKKYREGDTHSEYSKCHESLTKQRAFGLQTKCITLGRHFRSPDIKLECWWNGEAVNSIMTKYRERRTLGSCRPHHEEVSRGRNSFPVQHVSRISHGATCFWFADKMRHPSAREPR